MSSQLLCQQCRTPLQSSASGTFCPACVLRAATGDGDPAPQEESPEDFPRPFGPFELLAQVGRGGMGLVFKARQASLNRIVAIKVLAAGRFSDESERKRFQLEAESGAKLQHPNIVPIHEVGEAEGHPYISMDFVDGPNLADRCAGRPLPAGVATRYLIEMARAVDAAHQAGVVHRDIKPSNILIGSDQRIFVTDFGLAKLRADSDGPTLTGQVLGSPNYTSPEQAAGRNDRVGAASDIYGLGAVLYHLLTGRAPFNAATPTETLRLVLDAEPAAPRLLNPVAPRDLETICLKCLQKDPAQRYASAAALADDLERFLDHRPIAARPVSGPELAWRWCRRHPAAAGLAATVVVALVATSTVFYVSAHRIADVKRSQDEDLYAMHIGLSALALGSTGNDLRDARSRLAATRPAAGSPDLRGFEWRYLWSLARGDASVLLKGHQQLLLDGLFSPDGAVVATRSVDGVMKVWTAASGQELHSLGDVAAIGGFSPDGEAIFFSRPDRSVWRLAIASGASVRVTPPTGRLVGVAPDGQLVVVGPDSLPKSISLVAPESAAMSGAPPPDALAVMSRDGRYVALSGRTYPGILVIDVASQKQVAQFIDPRPVIAIALSPDGSKLVSSGFDAILKVWSVGRPEPDRAFRAFADGCWALSFSADGRSFAASGHNRQVRIWHTADWTEASLLTGHESTTHFVAFSPDSRQLLSGGEDELGLVWALPQQSLPVDAPQLLRGPNWIDSTPDLAFSPDSRFFVGTAADRTVKVWRTDTVECVASFPGEARTVNFSADGRRVQASGLDGVVRQWEIDRPELHATEAAYPLSKDWHVSSLSAAERIGTLAQQQAAFGSCSLCAISSARDMLNAGVPIQCTTLAVTKEGGSAFVGLASGEVEVWDVGHQNLRRRFAAHKLPVTSLAVSPDGRYLATGSLDNSTKLWDAASDTLLATFYSHNRPVWALAFSPDSQTLASGSCDKAIILCSVPLRRFLNFLWLYSGTPQGYEQEVRLLRFAPDGNTLAAALGDGSVRFYRAAPFSVTDAPDRRW